MSIEPCEEAARDFLSQFELEPIQPEQRDPWNGKCLTDRGFWSAESDNAVCFTAVANQDCRIVVDPEAIYMYYNDTWEPIVYVKDRS